MPRFWKNQERNDSSPHRIALGFNMLYASPLALGKITIKSLYFWRIAMGYLMPTQSLLYATDARWAWTPWMVSIYEIRPGHPDALAMAGWAGPDWILIHLGPLCQGCCHVYREAAGRKHPQTLSCRVVNFSEAIQYSCNYPGKHI